MPLGSSPRSPRGTPEQVRAAWDFLVGLPPEEVDRATSDLRRKVGAWEHPLSGVLSITITASGTLTVEQRTDDPATAVPVPAVVAEAAAKPVMDTEAALALVVVWLAFLQASSALAEKSMADFYSGLLASLPGLLLLFKNR